MPDCSKTLNLVYFVQNIQSSYRTISQQTVNGWSKVWSLVGQQNTTHSHALIAIGILLFPGFYVRTVFECWAYPLFLGVFSRVWRALVNTIASEILSELIFFIKSQTWNSISCQKGDHDICSRKLKFNLDVCLNTYIQLFIPFQVRDADDQWVGQEKQV